MKPPFRIAVLECDDPPPTSPHPGYTGWHADVLRAGAGTLPELDLSPDSDLSIKGWNVWKDPEHYPDDDEVDAILLTGSKMNAYDNDYWILKLVEYTKRILAQDRIRVIGVCFGHQIVGRALGAEVARGTLGWEISVHPIELSRKGKELFKRDTISLHHMHRDVVRAYPPTVEPLGTSPICPTQGMYIHRKLMTIQAHPEFNSKTMQWLLETRHDSGLFSDEVYEDAVKRVDDPHDGVLVGQAFVRFLLEE